MNAATKTIQLTVPSSDMDILERISKGMGWGLCVLKAEEEVAYLDSLDDEEYLGEAESAKLLEV